MRLRRRRTSALWFFHWPLRHALSVRKPLKMILKFRDARLKTISKTNRTTNPNLRASIDADRLKPLFRSLDPRASDYRLQSIHQLTIPGKCYIAIWEWEIWNNPSCVPIPLLLFLYMILKLNFENSIDDFKHLWCQQGHRGFQCWRREFRPVNANNRLVPYSTD